MSELEDNLYKKVQVPSTSTAPSVSRTYRGFYSGDSSKGFKLYDFEIIKQDLINHFHIRQGEKLGNPEFGCIIWDILFEPFTPALQQAIAENVTYIINYDPRISAEEVFVESYENGIQVSASVTYKSYSITEQLNFKFDSNIGLIDN